MQIRDKSQVINLLSTINEQYQNNIVKLKEANKEFEELNWSFLNKKKYFEANSFPNLTADQKYEMTGKQIDEYNQTRENAYIDYETKYNEEYQNYISSKWIVDFEVIVEEIINNNEVLNEKQRETFLNILNFTDWQRDFKVKTEILKNTLELITWKFTETKVETEEKQEEILDETENTENENEE